VDSRRRPVRLSAAALRLILTAAAFGVLGGCAAASGPRPSDGSPASSPAAATATPLPTASATPSPAPTPTPPPATPTPSTAPTITQFTAPNTVDCSAGQVTLTWSTRNDTGVNIDIDTPGGAYNSSPLPASGSDTVPFACGGSSGTVTQYYYLQTVGGSGPTATAEVIVKSSS